MDKRAEQHILCDGRELNIEPDLLADFTKMRFPDESFWLIVFDPPHMNSLGENSWLAKKYGRLIGDWRDDIREGFSECFGVFRSAKKEWHADFQMEHHGHTYRRSSVASSMRASFRTHDRKAG